MKSALNKFLGLVIITMILSACNNESAKTATDSFNLDSTKAEIAASNKVFAASWATGDSTAFTSCYTSDACIGPPNLPKMCGSTAISAFFNGGVQMGIKNIVITTEEVFGGKDGVIETGTYDMLVADNVSADKGKFIVMWKSENGKWKMFRDIWNSDAPPAPAQ